MIFDNYYFKGCISGMTGIVLSHPVDSIKTIIQTNYSSNYSKNLNNSNIYNIKNLYKGIYSPLIGVGFEKAIVFGTYNYCKNNYFNIPISGAISGLTASLIVSPYERIKIMKQTNQQVVFKQIISPSFLFKGLSVTFTREVPGFAIYFSTYEYLKNHFYKDNNISISSSFLFGGISGAMAWIFIYPQDRIKTIIQSNNNNNNISAIIKNLYKTGGFYTGFSFALARAILLHSGTFCTMELLSNNNYLPYN